MLSVKDIIMTSLLRKEGLLSIEKAESYLNQLRLLDSNTNLEEILISEGIITNEQLESSLKKIERATLKCNKCGKLYSPQQFPSDTNLYCPQCKLRVIIYFPPVIDQRKSKSEKKSNIRNEEQRHAVTDIPVSIPSEILSTEIGIDKLESPMTSWILNPNMLIGQKVDNYEILEVLGQGGMGVVYKALHTLLNRIVALKILAPTTGDLGKVGERFIREAQILASLNSHYIVQIYNMGKWMQSYYIDMEFVEGKSLAHKIEKEKQLNVKEAVEIILQACQGLKVAHESKVIHRDIKPENILISKEGNIKIADFGLARLSVIQGSLSRSGQIMGTPYYMSPEQAQGKKLDERSDIYSLGVMFYYMLSGKQPFYAESVMAVLYRQVHELPPPIMDNCPDIPEVLVGILDRMMAKDPNDRYVDVSHIIEDLERISKGKKVRAQKRSYLIKRDSSPKKEKHNFVKLSLAFSLSFIFVLLFIFFVFRGKEQASIKKELEEKQEVENIKKQCRLEEDKGSYLEAINLINNKVKEKPALRNALQSEIEKLLKTSIGKLTEDVEKLILKSEFQEAFEILKKADILLSNEKSISLISYKCIEENINLIREYHRKLNLMIQKDKELKQISQDCLPLIEDYRYREAWELLNRYSESIDKEIWSDRLLKDSIEKKVNEMIQRFFSCYTKNIKMLLEKKDFGPILNSLEDWPLKEWLENPQFNINNIGKAYLIELFKVQKIHRKLRGSIIKIRESINNITSHWGRLQKNLQKSSQVKDVIQNFIDESCIHPDDNTCVKYIKLVYINKAILIFEECENRFRRESEKSGRSKIEKGIEKFEDIRPTLEKRKKEAYKQLNIPDH